MNPLKIGLFETGIIRQIIQRYSQAIGLVYLLMLMAWFYCPPVLAEVDEPRVLVTIKPYHSLVSRLLSGITVPKLLIDDYQSPHSFQLSPRQALEISKAKVIIWSGPSLETPLSQQLNHTRRQVIQIMANDNHDESEHAYEKDDHHDSRHDSEYAHEKDEHHNGHHDSEYAHEKDEHHNGHHDSEYAHEKDEHHNGHHDSEYAHEKDPHRWLDPLLTIQDIQYIAKQFALLYPAHRKQVMDNQRQLVSKMKVLHGDIQKTLANQQQVSGLLYHAAWDYFLKRYRLRVSGVINPMPHRQPKVQHLRKLFEIVQKEKPRCLFIEPQFKPQYVDTLAPEKGFEQYTLDPLGADIAQGREHYFQMMHQIANTFARCLL